MYCVFFSFAVDLSLYKDESQIENKKTSGKRKLSEKADSATPATKKRKDDSAESATANISAKMSKNAAKSTKVI